MPHNVTPQVFIDISLDQLLAKVEDYQKRNWRFVNVNASTVGANVELIYSFANGLPFENLRLTVDTETEVPSISDMFPAAFLFENEGHDLFGVKFTGIAIDFNGELYTLSLPTPMNLSSTVAKKAAADGSYAAASADVKGSTEHMVSYPDDRPRPSRPASKAKINRAEVDNKADKTAKVGEEG
ncbi:MAG: NADH-quinone oxidoreductase subunit C [Coriobacteriales bacterium]|jgi:ech hydrogenase subunit D|nr:NADH-quinone oxidoreductase subunit C [Coriobacteriales bacterium]